MIIINYYLQNLKYLFKKSVEMSIEFLSFKAINFIISFNKWYNIIDFNTKLYIYIYIHRYYWYLTIILLLSFFFQDEQLNYLHDKRIKYNFPQMIIIIFENLCFTFFERKFYDKSYMQLFTIFNARDFKDYFQTKKPWQIYKLLQGKQHPSCNSFISHRNGPWKKKI